MATKKFSLMKNWWMFIILLAFLFFMFKELVNVQETGEAKAATTETITTPETTPTETTAGGETTTGGSSTSGGSSSGGGTTGGGTTCTPKTCADLGYSCGTVDDGCGATLSCGTCTAGQTCSATTHSCQVSCTPNCSGKTCGDDGCGGSCGTCTAGQTCSAGVCTCVVTNTQDHYCCATAVGSSVCTVGTYPFCPKPTWNQYWCDNCGTPTTLIRDCPYECRGSDGKCL